MTQPIRKKKQIDGMDRDILRFLYGNHPQPKTSNEIARRVNLTPPAIFPRLKNLQSQGIVKQKEIGGLRKFERNFGVSKKSTKVQAPSKIFWGLDIRPKKKR
jgi:DNA-binding Lrp family transcriptional regulator